MIDRVYNNNKNKIDYSISEEEFVNYYDNPHYFHSIIDKYPGKDVVFKIFPSFFMVYVVKNEYG